MTNILRNSISRKFAFWKKSDEGIALEDVFYTTQARIVSPSFECTVDRHSRENSRWMETPYYVVRKAEIWSKNRERSSVSRKRLLTSLHGDTFSIMRKTFGALKIELLLFRYRCFCLLRSTRSLFNESDVRATLQKLFRTSCKRRLRASDTVNYTDMTSVNFFLKKQYSIWFDICGENKI